MHSPIQILRRYRRQLRRDRRGAALMTVMLLIGSIGALAAAGIYLAENAAMMSRAQERERELRYAADNALQMAKSRMNINAAVLPDTGFDSLMTNAVMYNAANDPIPGLLVNAYIGPSGDASGQSGILNGMLLVEARTPNGAGFVRALELTQESFAKYAYWSDRERQVNGNTIYFGNNDQIWGPVWSNDNISIDASRATFHDLVQTAGTISGVGNGTFKKSYKTNQPRIELPDNRTLDRLKGYATSAGFAFEAGSTGDENSVRTRIEFMAADLNNDGDSTDVDEGLFRVFKLHNGESPTHLRGDWQGDDDLLAVTRCGDWHTINTGSGNQSQFFPASVHNQTWLRDLLRDRGGMTVTQANAHTIDANNATKREALLESILATSTARCFPAGDPHLAAVERRNADGTLRSGYTNTTFPGTGGSLNASANIGGTPFTFTPSGRYGFWHQASTSPVAPIAARFGAFNNMSQYLYAAYRGLNPGARGVIYTNGTVALSGVLRGRITLFADNGSVVIIDDLRYAKDPSIINPDPSKQCEESDILGIIAEHNVVVADNAINSPRRIEDTGNWRWYDHERPQQVWVHAVVMALNTSFGAQNYNAGASNSAKCEGTDSGRGCLYLHGGVIQQVRGAVGLVNGVGFVKRYSYDKCAASAPPPYFPTTGRFIDNEYTEIDPVGFTAAGYFNKVRSRQ